MNRLCSQVFINKIQYLENNKIIRRSKNQSFDNKWNHQLVSNIQFTFFIHEIRATGGNYRSTITCETGLNFFRHIKWVDCFERICKSCCRSENKTVKNEFHSLSRWLWLRKVKFMSRSSIWSILNPMFLNWPLSASTGFFWWKYGVTNFSILSADINWLYCSVLDSWKHSS